ncbi:MAG: hypothetical protein DLM62_14680 [Pseudonocardiales bacterium]|nr:MAG: hypothetical protein DLM62_14680 [Pseudonocardiales bacterium]
MRRTAATFTVIASALLLAACSSPATTASSQPASPVATQASAPTSAAAQSSAAATQPGVATSLNPCQLVTSSEASSLAGTTYGPGLEERSGKDGKRCVYGSQTTNVFTVEVGQAKNPATAQADWSKEQARAQALVNKKLPAGISLSFKTRNVPGLGDRAATVSGSTSAAGQSIALSGIYLRKSATFLAFQDVLLGHAAPSTGALEAEARTALARVP